VKKREFALVATMVAVSTASILASFRYDWVINNAQASGTSIATYLVTLCAGVLGVSAVVGYLSMRWL
jgi:hypothetical protein